MSNTGEKIMIYVNTVKCCEIRKIQSRQDFSDITMFHMFLMFLQYCTLYCRTPVCICASGSPPPPSDITVSRSKSVSAAAATNGPGVTGTEIRRSHDSLHGIVTVTGSLARLCCEARL